MSDTEMELTLKKAVLRMNTKLRESGYNERERAFMWGMTITEQREFLTKVWEQVHNDPEFIETLPESSQRKATPGPPNPKKTIQTDEEK